MTSATFCCEHANNGLAFKLIIVDNENTKLLADPTFVLAKLIIECVFDYKALTTAVYNQVTK